jgi:hypothetical protein
MERDLLVREQKPESLTLLYVLIVDTTPESSHTTAAAPKICILPHQTLHIYITMSAAYTAIPFDDSARRTPLLVEEQSSAPAVPTLVNPTILSQFKTCSMFLGLFLGFFIQLTTLGSNFLLVTSAGVEHGGFHVVLKTRGDLILFSLTWSLFTSMMAILVMFLLRAMVTLTHNSTGLQAEMHLEHLLSNLECRYVMGALMGVCLAWAVTDIMLGMRGQVVFSLIALVVSLIWCKATIWFFALDKPQETQEANLAENHKLMVV